MSKGGKRLLLGGGAVFLACAAFVGWMMAAAGQFRTIEAAGNVTCDVITGMIGAEDIVVDLAHGRAFVSSDDRRATLAGQPVRGRIYALDLTQTPPVPRDVTPPVPEAFHPHGISLFTDPETGAQTLFVVNHIEGGVPRAGISRAEMFSVAEDGSLGHRGGVIGAAMASPNDILAVGPNQFYASNDHGSETAAGLLLETLFMLPRANVVYYDGKEFRTVAEGISFANGLGLSPDGQFLHVAETTGFAVRTYRRDAASGALDLLWTTPVANGVDNIDMAPDGRLYVAGHPHLLDFLAHTADPASPSPSEVVRLTPGGDGLMVETLLTAPGTILSGASVAAYAGPGRFLVGAVYEEKVLDCRER
ncbi:MAG: SMP-30/gluconolactonase/LRE family protein [Zavarzinia sp.]|nr:SMP-30/gluconolactonase/LRE family protein [Zavarzinia sp.]